MLELVQKNKYGYYELKEKPSQTELEEYYTSKYYQNAMGGYEKSYSNQEIRYIQNKMIQKYAIIEKMLTPITEHTPYSFLDIGCGEGWALQFFKNRTWNVLGLDYSEYGCKQNNPSCSENLKTGDIYHNIHMLINEGRSFHCIWLDNVLEHVVEPLSLLQDCKKLINTNGILVIEVPNDFSTVQQCLLNSNYISKPFWIAQPDHISYFNKEGLELLCLEAGWKCNYLMGDYPIDFNLFNENTNYVENPSVGKSCHHTRIAIENLLHDVSPEKTNELYHILGELGLGRQIIGFFK